jgi:outer membrane protein OmpA-like peptidoglycan-associated protein
MERPSPRTAAAAEPPAQQASSKFDVVRIDPDGASVFAGRAPANSQVTVLANDMPIATARADGTGAWATVIEKPFPSGDYQLSLRAKSTGPLVEAPGQSVRITIAAAPPAAVPTPVKSPTAAAVKAPAPITFVYDEATFTDPGRREAAALTEFLRQRRLGTVTLSGHTDGRGSDSYNMELSRQRLEAVARFLREAGFTGKLVLVPKGKREPYDTPDRAKLPKEDAFQLDRRVELHATP